MFQGHKVIQIALSTDFLCLLLGAQFMGKRISTDLLDQLHNYQLLTDVSAP
jgi:hypothetical protein